MTLGRYDENVNFLTFWQAEASAALIFSAGARYNRHRTAACDALMCAQRSANE